MTDEMQNFSHKIRVGQIFRVSPLKDSSDGYANFYLLTKGIHDTGVGDGGMGIFNYRTVMNRCDGVERIPAFILHSNPHKEGSKDNPWVDVINADEGYAIYNGDNKSEKGPLEANGNKQLVKVMPLYESKEGRIHAPPILMFKQEIINNKRKGYRSFQGYGIPIRAFLRTQRSTETHIAFTNVVFEIALFNLQYENEEFDWTWIDMRRDSHSTANECLKFAPRAWKEWVNKGEENIDKFRRRVSVSTIVSKNNQLSMADNDRKILDSIYEFYASNKYSFEGLAIDIAKRVVGDAFIKGWVTQQSGDMGIDFVGRVNIGNDFSAAKITILGQAKCIHPNSCISGHDLSRLVARLQRGWLGIFVTTGVYSESAQKELAEDKYPLILINGQRIVREVKQLLAEENKFLTEYLDEQLVWYRENYKNLSVNKADYWEFPTEIRADGI